MIHFNYHDGTSANQNKSHFLNEGLSLSAEVVCGYQFILKGYYNSEYNHYLFDWRSGDDVLKDYSRRLQDMLTIYMINLELNF